jgi:hypothetical protein
MRSVDSRMSRAWLNALLCTVVSPRRRIERLNMSKGQLKGKGPL